MAPDFIPQAKEAGIFWLASFPKSGNTWIRAFLSCLMGEDRNKVDINALDTGTIASSREWVSEGLGVEIDELSHDEVDYLRPKAYKWLAQNTQTYYHKVHDAYTYLPDGSPLFPPEITRGVVLIVRNPLDIVLSWANHSNMSTTESIKEICSSDSAFGKTLCGQVNQLRQVLLSWSEHTMSWLRVDVPRIAIRYEDLMREPQTYFSYLCEFLNIDASHSDIERAIELTRFDQLRKQEEKAGFYEKSSKVKHFFRKGIVGDWQTNLSEKQIQQVISANYEAMALLGYLDENGHPMTNVNAEQD